MGIVKPSPISYLNKGFERVLYVFRGCKSFAYSECMSNAQQWAGQRLGLPENGEGSLAKLGRRVVAISIDWALSMLVSQAFAQGNSTITLLVFALEQWLLIGTLGYSIGHRVLGLQVRRLDGKYVGLWRSLIRVGLILLVLPATIWDADNRGMHDKAAGTVLIRTK
jgi:uncharacterized RDD family membrane protein YckC